MDGITVLNQNFSHVSAAAIVYATLLCVFAIAGIIVSILALCDDEKGLGIILLVVSAILLILGIAGYYFSKTDYTEQILIDECVPFSYIEEHYEIIDKEGKIYTVKIKGD